jgi:hypothetical protein
MKAYEDYTTLLARNTEVEFNEDDHTYFLNGQNLTSVTTFLSENSLSPDFGDIPLMLLAKLADRGTSVHKLLETYLDDNFDDKKGIDNFPDYIDYKLKETYGKAILESKLKKEYMNFITEFTVASPKYGLAGKIDVICGDTVGGLTIMDLKSGNPDKMDFWYAAWQMALYKKLLEEQNNVSVRRLVVMYFPRTAKGDMYLKSIDLTDWIDDISLGELLESRITGETFTGSKVIIRPDDRKSIVALEEWAVRFNKATKDYKALEAKFDEMREEVVSVMEKYSINNISIGKEIDISYVKGFSREGVDAPALKASHPKIYEEFKKISVIKPSVRCYARKVKEIK